MSLWAIADIHISYKSNREAIQSLKPRPDDGLILAGDSMLHSSQFSLCNTLTPLRSRRDHGPAERSL
jgi:predicted phosphodiesterase